MPATFSFVEILDINRKKIIRKYTNSTINRRIEEIVGERAISNLDKTMDVEEIGFWRYKHWF